MYRICAVLVVVHKPWLCSSCVKGEVFSLLEITQSLKSEATNSFSTREFKVGLFRTVSIVSFFIYYRHRNQLYENMYSNRLPPFQYGKSSSRTRHSLPGWHCVLYQSVAPSQRTLHIDPELESGFAGCIQSGSCFFRRTLTCSYDINHHSLYLLNKTYSFSQTD